MTEWIEDRLASLLDWRAEGADKIRQALTEFKCGISDKFCSPIWYSGGYAPNMDCENCGRDVEGGPMTRFHLLGIILNDLRHWDVRQAAYWLFQYPKEKNATARH